MAYAAGNQAAAAASARQGPIIKAFLRACSCISGASCSTSCSQHMHKCILHSMQAHHKIKHKLRAESERHDCILHRMQLYRRMQHKLR